MEFVVNSRKRPRSELDEQDFTLQSKHFISERAVNMNDSNKMKEIHEKTIKMLFRNANVAANKNYNNNNNNNNTKSNVEQDFTLPSKQVVGDQTVNDGMNDANMEDIHEKTIKMLFRNANATTNNNQAESTEYEQPKWQQFRDNICLMGNGQINFIGSDANKSTALNATRCCRLCAKESNIQATVCINCNLEICEFCGISCIHCNAPLCMSCVQLFGCHDNSVDMNACCECCKQIYNI